MTRRPGDLLGLLWMVLLVAFGVSLMVGPGLVGLPGDASARALIFWDIRLPRALLAAGVGAGLGMAGAALQGYLRNPLAEPGIIGVSGGAALGAVTMIHLGLGASVPLAVPIAGLIGAAASTGLVVMLAGAGGGPVPLMLAGVAISSLTSAALWLVLTLARNPFATSESVFWLMGSFVDRSWLQVVIALPLIAGGMAALFALGRALDALTLGETAAQSLGIDLVRSQRLLVAGVTLTVGAATAVSGIVGFVGLVVPHLFRPLVAQRPGHLLAASALGGAVLLLVADTVLRLVSPWFDLRIGVLTSLLGAPFFIALVWRLRGDLAP